MLGTTLGSYRIEKELGRGGMGAVYTAVHTLLGRRAAVKVLLAELSQKQDLVQRFFNEARAATAIKHPSIVEIYDFGWAADGSAYIVMELMDGEPLSARLKRHGRLPVPAALTIARQVANALHAAHKAGIIHRDLKPDNVFLVPDVEVAGGERVKLLDFGIAKLAGEGHVSQTSTGAVMGTPLYMSPEQCEGARLVDPRSDLYSLGCMLFEMVSGRVPFVSEGVGGLIGMHLFVPAPSVREVAPDVPPEIDALVAKLLAKAPGERYQSADELAGALGRLGVVSGPMTAAAPMPSSPGMLAPSPSGASWPGGPPAPSGPSWSGAAAPASSGASWPAQPPGVVTTMSSAAGAHAVTGSAPRSRRGLWLAAGGIAVAGAAVAIVLAAGGGGGEKVSAAAVVIDAAAEPSLALDAGEVPAIVVDAATAPAPVDARPRDEAIATAPVTKRAIDAGTRAPVPLPAPTPLPAPRPPRPTPTTGPLTDPTITREPPRPTPTTGPLPVPKPPAPSANDDAAFDALHEQAKEAAYTGDYKKALSLCQRELKLRPREERALFNCAIFAFQLNNCTLAERYLATLHTDKADKLRQRCADERAARPDVVR